MAEILKIYLQGVLKSLDFLGETAISRPRSSIHAEYLEYACDTLESEGLSGFQMDKRNLYGDWIKVGKDIQTSVNKIASEPNVQEAINA